MGDGGGDAPVVSGAGADKTLTGAELRDRRDYVEFLRHQLEMARRRLSVLGELREEKRNVWRERRREYKGVRKVLERERARWQTNGAKEEQKVIDEMAKNGKGAALGGHERGSRGEHGSVVKALLVAMLVATLTMVILYSVRLVGGNKIAFLSSGIVVGSGTTPSPADGVGAASPIADATGAVAATPTPGSTGMLVTSDMIHQTLAQIEDERARLAEREAALAAWEQQLNRRQAELDALIARYDAMRQEIETDLAEQRALKEWREGEERKQREASIKRLARLYEKTRAREAAVMMMELDKVEAQEVLLAMNERQAVKILGEMSKANPKRATDLLESISEDADRLLPPPPAP